MSDDLEKRLRELAGQFRDYLGPCGADYTVIIDNFRKAAAIGAEIEREECAHECQTVIRCAPTREGTKLGAWSCLNAIRARGGK